MSSLVDDRIEHANARVLGRKDDDGKDPWYLMPWVQLTAVVKVLRFGADIYGEGNWQQVPRPRDRYFAAVLRHLLAWYQGEKLDAKSGLPHLAHAISSLLFLLWFDDKRTPDKP